MSADTLVREVTDEELAEEVAKVRRHRWQERAAMGSAIGLGFAGLAAWYQTGFMFTAALAMAAAMVAYRKLSPKQDPLDAAFGPRDPAPIDPEVRVMAARVAGPGPFAWLASHYLSKLVATACTLAGAAAGFGAWLAWPRALDARFAMLAGTLIGSVGGYFAARAARRRMLAPAE